jgi:hypothetical protein
MVYTGDLKSPAFGHAGSSPATGTKQISGGVDLTSGSRDNVSIVSTTEIRMFVYGDRVETTRGFLRRGYVCSPVQWNEATDGVRRKPGQHDVPILWDEGTMGYYDSRDLKLVRK